MAKLQAQIYHILQKQANHPKNPIQFVVAALTK
jgi:hypothetical protein